MKSIFLILILAQQVFSQTFSIEGRVFNKKNEPLEYVKVNIKELQILKETDDLGRFSFSGLDSGNITLEFFLQGYAKHDLQIQLDTNVTNLIIQLDGQSVQKEEVIVTANKHENRIEDLTISASILPGEIIQNRNDNSISDALKYVSGVSVVMDQVSIRGSSGYTRGAGARVLFAIDGFPFYSGDTGEIIWEMFSSDVIKKVEVVKGAASSLYGAGALGGIVNIITDNSYKQNTIVKASGGVYDNPHYSQWKWSDRARLFNTVSVSYSDFIDDFRFNISVLRFENDGYRENGFTRRHIVFLNSGYKFSDRTNLNFLFNYINQKNGSFLYWKNSAKALEDIENSQYVASNRAMFGLDFSSLLFGNFSYTIKVSDFISDWKDQSVSQNKSKSNMIRGEVQVTGNITDKLFLISGVESYYSNVNSNIFSKKSSTSFGAYFQLEQNLFQKLAANYGLRFDYKKTEDIKSQNSFSPRVGLNYKLNDFITLRSNLSYGFRSPSLAEIFTTTTVSGIVVRPNLNLLPENNFTLEAGALLKFEPFIFDAAVYYSKYKKLIEAVIEPSGRFIHFENLADAEIKGFELSLSTKLFNEILNIKSGYNFNLATDINTKKFLKYRSKHIFNTNVGVNLEPFAIGFDYRFLSKPEEIDWLLVDLGIVPEGNKVVDIHVFDFYTSYNFLILDMPIKLFFNVKNLFNYNYVEMIGNLGPIRNYSLTVELNL